MNDLDMALATRRSERMLQQFGLDQMVSEPIMRERTVLDDEPARLNYYERQGLMVVAEVCKEKNTWDSPDG